MVERNEQIKWAREMRKIEGLFPRLKNAVATKSHELARTLNETISEYIDWGRRLREDLVTNKSKSMLLAPGSIDYDADQAQRGIGKLIESLSERLRHCYMGRPEAGDEGGDDLRGGPPLSPVPNPMSPNGSFEAAAKIPQQEPLRPSFESPPQSLEPAGKILEKAVA